MAKKVKEEMPETKSLKISKATHTLLKIYSVETESNMTENADSAITEWVKKQRAKKKSK